MIFIATMAMGMCVSVNAQQQEQQEGPGQQQEQQQAGPVWGSKGRVSTGKKPKPAKKSSGHGVIARQVSGGQQQQQQQNQSVTVTGADSARVSAIEAELAILKARPDPSAAILERIKNLEDELTLLKGRVAGLEATTRAQGSRIEDHETRIQYQENRRVGMTRMQKVELHGNTILNLINLACNLSGRCRFGGGGHSSGPLVSTLPPGPGLR